MQLWIMCACVHLCVLSRFGCVWLFVIPWTVAHQAPLSVGFSRQEYWGGVPFPPPGDPPHLRTEPTSLTSPALAGGFLTTSITWEALLDHSHLQMLLMSLEVFLKKLG